MKFLTSLLAILFLAAIPAQAQTDSSTGQFDLTVTGSVTIADVIVSIDGGIVGSNDGEVNLTGAGNGLRWDITTEAGTDLFLSYTIPAEMTNGGTATIPLTFESESAVLSNGTFNGGATMIVHDPNVGVPSFVSDNGNFWAQVGRGGSSVNERVLAMVSGAKGSTYSATVTISLGIN
jgi:hypothetical protein